MTFRYETRTAPLPMEFWTLKSDSNVLVSVVQAETVVTLIMSLDFLIITVMDIVARHCRQCRFTSAFRNQGTKTRVPS